MYAPPAPQWMVCGGCSPYEVGYSLRWSRQPWCVVTEEPSSGREADPIAADGSRTRDARSAVRSEALQALRPAILLIGLIACFGMLARWHLLVSGLARPFDTNIFYRLYALYELPHLVLLLAFAIATGGLVAWGRASAVDPPAVTASLPRRWTWLVALAILLAGVAITHLVMHDLLFSMDEFSADFQARAFARGEIAPVVHWPWRSLRDAIVPIFVQLDESTGRWTSQYLPVFALIKVPFLVAHLEAWLNPLLTAASFVTLGAITRQIWPGERTRPLVALALFATSSQILVTSGTGYSMPAHLFLNLVWLSLYLRGDQRSWIVALVVGALALGLHSPFPHALFVAPFLLRQFYERHWTRVASACMAYGCAGLVWLIWLQRVHPPAPGGESVLLHVFAMPNFGALALHVMNFSLLLTWHAPVLGPLLFAAVAYPRRMTPLQRDLAVGLFLTLLFFVFFPLTQGHGWGYRYAHQVLGNLCLLGAEGVGTMASVIGARRTRTWLLLGFATSLVIQLPLRLRDTEHFVRPFARAQEYVQSRQAAVVLIDGESIWYGRDLIRNDPFLRFPIVARRERLSQGFVDQMRAAIPQGVLELSAEDLVRLGMTRSERWISLGELSERRRAAVAGR